MSEFNENLRPDEQLEPNAAPADSPAVQPEPAFQPEPVVESAAETPQEFPFTPPAIPQFIPDAPIKTKKVRAKKAGNTKSRAFSGKLIAMILCLSLLGGLIGGAISGSMLFLFSDQDDDDDDRKSIFENDKDTIKGEPNNGEDITTVVPEGQRDKVTIEKQPIDTSELKSVQQVYADNVDSIVGISTNYVTENWWGGKQEGGSAGSGVVYSADGYILTNHHVIEKAETITVHFHDGTSKPATLLGYDVNNDIAVLKAEATDLQPAIWVTPKS